MSKVTKQFIQDHFTVEATITSVRVCEQYASTVFHIDKDKALKPLDEKIKQFGEEGGIEETSEYDIGDAVEEFWAEYKKYENPVETINSICANLRNLGIDLLLCFIYMERFYASMHEKDKQVIPKYRRPYVTVKDVYELVQFTPTELIKMVEAYYSRYIEHEELVQESLKNVEKGKEEGNEEDILLSEQIEFVKSKVAQVYNVSHYDFERMPVSEFYRLMKNMDFAVAKRVKDYGSGQ